ncbi:uncharacterized protein N7511_010212 [Penicillium nucicola]|uniref:uncharacterized protein n=1 Tax=Penicillium nucicola TaxID=1850975 RepID=UPI0025455271|nr:uncharacterized protein N7511_010212 [Penicillium nucicola]KAJ5748516.1 hypothetical protein N7511_010212 [Penicillium nucicola]
MEASLPEGSPELQHSPSDSHALFDRLPANVIERILFAADANTFASLALLNQTWKHASDTPALYAYHLTRCPSFSWTHGANPLIDTESLTDLKRLFLKEIRQNAFDVFLRPRQTLVRLISSSMSSSTAFPQGEVFRFSFSANGQMVLCISSSRIVILDVASDPVAVKHELQTRRRPLGAAVRDDGSLIAVLSSTHRVHIYQLSDDEAIHIQVITLNDAPRDIAFSPTGSILALAFEDSIEVYAVGEDAKPTDRRAVRCLRVDGLSFSPDGSMLLGSSSDCERDGVVAITAPFYTETGTDASPEELHSRMWTTQILFPEITRGCTHACLIAGHEDSDENWVMGYDSQLAAFRALRLNDVNAGVVYFASPFIPDETREMQPSMAPATDDAGELVALGFQDSTLCIYGVPGRLDLTAPATGTPNELTGTKFGGTHHCEGRPPRDNLAQLQKIIQQPKILIRGRHVADMKGVTSARWVRATGSTETKRHYRRLVAVAPGGVRPQIFGEEDIPVDGGRVLLLDFERCTTNGEILELDIEVGETAPKILREPDSSMDTEVELERRRTRLHRGDTATTFASASHQRLAAPRDGRALPFHFRRFSVTSPTLPADTSRGDALDLPYDNTQPRSSDVLHRAATAAASTRGRYDPRYRNSPSRRNLPHESDTDNWVPPPPPYKQETEAPLPDDLLRTLLPRNMVGPHAVNDSVNHPERAQTTRIARPTVSTRPRPQSAILQRLGNLTGSRRRGSSIGRDDLYFSQQSESPTISAPREQSINDILPSTEEQTPYPDTAASLAHHHPAVQAPPTFAVHPAEQIIQENPMPLPYLGASALGDAYFPYSVSSPNLLHIPQPHGEVQETVADDEHEIPHRQRSFRRRVSTEPTSLPPPENEEWRRRIQDWNEHTIKERGRKRRGKCIVM